MMAYSFPTNLLASQHIMMLDNQGKDALSTAFVSDSNPPIDDGGQTLTVLATERKTENDRGRKKHVIISTEKETVYEGSIAMSHNKHRMKCQTFKKYLRSTICFFFSHIGLCIVVAAYCVMGAFMFRAIEREHQLGMIDASQNQISRNYSQINETIWDLQKDILSFALKQFNEWSSHINKLRNQQLANLTSRLRSKNNLTELHEAFDRLFYLLTNITDRKDDVGISLWLSQLDLTEGGNTHTEDVTVSFTLHVKTFEAITINATDRVALLSSRLVQAAYQAWESGLKPRLETRERLNQSNRGFPCNCKSNQTHCRLACLYPGEVNKKEDPWSITVALLYTITVITTIGYGHIVPRTDLGRAVTVVYALFGVPLVLMCLANLGGFLADGVRFIYRHSCLRLYRIGRNRRRTLRVTKQTDREDKGIEEANFSNLNVDINFLDDSDVSETSIGDVKMITHDPQPCKDRLQDSVVHYAQETGRRLSSTLDKATHNFIQSLAGSQSIISTKHKKRTEEIGVPIWQPPLIIFIYVAVGAIIFANWEDWSLMESGYFLFITLSTIGFGDYVPGVERHESYSTSGRSIFCCFYLLFGLSLVAMSFHLMQEDVKIKFHRFAKKIGLVD